MEVLAAQTCQYKNLTLPRTKEVDTKLQDYQEQHTIGRYERMRQDLEKQEAPEHVS